MKNISNNVIGFVFTVLVFVLGFTFVSKVHAVATPILTIGSITAPIGSNVSVPITANGWQNSVSALELLVNYDRNKLTINSITPNSNLSGALFNKNYAPNTIYISYMADVNENFDFDNGIVATLNFTVIATVDTTTNLNFKTTAPGARSKLYDKYGSTKPAIFSNGSINIIPVPLPTLSSISIVHSANKLNYLVGEVLDISGLQVVGQYSDGSSAVLPITESNILGFNSTYSQTGQILTIVCDSKTASYSININTPVIFTPDLTIGSISASFGSNISVPITASDFKNTVAGMDLLISYDPTKLVINSITKNPDLGVAAINKDYASDLIYISYLADLDTNFNLDNGVVATLNFTVIVNSNTTTNLEFKTTTPGAQSKLYDVYGSTISATFGNGTVNITPIVLPKAIQKSKGSMSGSYMKPAIIGEAISKDEVVASIDAISLEENSIKNSNIYSVTKILESPKIDSMVEVSESLEIDSV